MKYPKGEVGLISVLHTFPEDFKVIFGEPPVGRSVEEQNDYTRAYRFWHGLVDPKDPATKDLYDLIRTLGEKFWAPNGLTARPFLWRREENARGDMFLAFPGAPILLTAYKPADAVVAPGGVLRTFYIEMVKAGHPIYDVNQSGQLMSKLNGYPPDIMKRNQELIQRLVQQATQQVIPLQLD